MISKGNWSRRLLLPAIVFPIPGDISDGIAGLSREDREQVLLSDQEYQDRTGLNAAEGVRENDSPERQALDLKVDRT
jgi:hypothetical protein